MACELTHTHLHAYLDGELDAAGALAFEQHLGSCPDCSAALQVGRDLRGALSSAQLYEAAPANLRTKVLSQLPAESPARPGRQDWWRWAALAAALLLCAFLGREVLSILRARSGGALLAAAAVDAHLRSLQPGHLADVPSTDQHTVKPWFEGRINFAPSVRDFSANGFPLLGGRLDVLAGHSAAALVYGHGKHILNVFVFPSSTGLPEPSGERNGYHWLAWQAAGLTYLAVSDTSSSDLQQLRGLFLGE